jgi:hypothetical protein
MTVFKFALGCLTISGLLIGDIATSHAQNPPEFAVVPAAPKDLERLILQVRSGGCGVTVGVRFDNGTIRVDLTDPGLCFPEPPPFGGDFVLGQFPAGTYPVVVYRDGAVAYSTQVVVTERATQRSKIDITPSIDVNDLWWNPQESGWGLSIAQNASDQIFAVWNVYDATGRATWYTLTPGQWSDLITYTGPIYRTTGPYWGDAFDPSLVATTAVGTGTLKLLTYATATFSYVVDGVSATKPIARLIQR